MRRAEPVPDCEDERDEALKQIQKDTDEYIGKIDETASAKEAEIMEV